jgi:aminoglycoside 6'-N-acetyltransferase
VGDSGGAAAVDMFIGEDASAGRGLGAAALRAFLQESVFSDPALIRCFIDPHPDNSVAIRAYIRVGFSPLRRVDPAPPAEPCLLLSIERTAIEGEG